MPTRMTVFASATLAALVCASVLSVHWPRSKLPPTIVSRSPTRRRRKAAIGIIAWIKPVTVAAGIGAEGRKGAPGVVAEAAARPNHSPVSIAADGNGNPRDACATCRPRGRCDRDLFHVFAGAPTISQCRRRRAGGASSAISGAGGPAIMHPGDGYLLARPALTAADLAAAERPPRLNAKLEPMLVYVAGALAVVMLFRKVLRSFAIRRLRRRRLTLRDQWNEELRATRSREPISQASAGTVAATHPAQSRRKSVTVPRTAEIPRPPADDRDTDRGIQALGVEERLQQLLYRWQQQSGGKPASACRAQYTLLRPEGFEGRLANIGRPRTISSARIFRHRS